MTPLSYIRIPIFWSRVSALPMREESDVKSSIRSHIMLMMLTHRGESRFDRAYGCSLWEYSFSPVDSRSTMEQDISRSIEEAIKHYEPRLDKKSIRVQIQIKETSGIQQSGTKITQHIKLLLEIKITGKTSGTAEPFEMKEIIYIDPMATQ